MYSTRGISEMSSCPMSSSSITGLLSALCDCSLSGVSWKRRSFGGVSRVGLHRALRRRAYATLLSKLFQDSSAKPSSAMANALADTPPYNKMLMISFELRVSGRAEDAERLEGLLGQLREAGRSSGLTELDSVLELLAQLAGSGPPLVSSFSRDCMRRERPVLRRPALQGYLSEELQRLESRTWALVLEEEWGAFRGVCRTLSVLDAPPGTGLFGLERRLDGEERFERDTRLSLFGALQHSRTADLDVRLDFPPVPSNADVTGLNIRVPQGLDQSEDEGFQSASNLTPDSQSEQSPSPEPDMWEALRTFVPARRRCWENVGCPPGQKEPPYLTEAGREAFDRLYRLWEGEMRNMLSSHTPSPLLPLPLDCQTQLVKDLLNVLIGVASVTFPLNESSVQFDVRADVCVSGTSPESVSRLLEELARYGTHYLRLSRFSLGSADKKGLVFQAFTGGLRRYLHYYRACVLSTPASLSLLTIGFHFRKLGRQLRYLAELCCVDGAAGARQAAFPVGVKLLSYLYNEAQSNCSNENYPVLLSLLKSSCEPYTRFVSDWMYSGFFRDVYKEFMIQVNEDYLSYRDKHFWVQGYTLISQDAEDCVPVFLRHIANDVYVCGKTINLLKICCPQHYIWSEVPVPRIAVTFSLREVEEIERDCAVYRGRMETIAKHSAISREEQALRTELARQELINQVRESAAKTLESIRGHQLSQRLAEEAKKRERFEELRHQLELDQEWRNAVKMKQQEDDYSFARELRDREQRLQALEEQLERRARMDLIAQYSRLSEEAAKKERRALWKVQRLRLHEARVNFLEQDQHTIQVLLVRHALGQECPSQDPDLTKKTPQDQQESHTPEIQMKNLTMEQKLTALSDSTLPPPCPPAVLPPSTRNFDALISDQNDITDFLMKRPHPTDSTAVTKALQDIGCDLSEFSKNPNSDYDFSSPYSPLECLRPQSRSAHPSLSHQVPEPGASQHGHPSQNSCHLEGNAASGHTSHASPSELQPAKETQEQNVATNKCQETNKLPKEKMLNEEQKEPSACAVDLKPKPPTDSIAEEAKASEQLAQPLRTSAEQIPIDLTLITGSSQDSDLQSKSKNNVSGVASVSSSNTAQGHSFNADIRTGGLVSDATVVLPSPSIHGHASDAHIKVGENVSEVTVAVPSRNIHGHASDANIMVGEHVSEVTMAVPSRNIHGHVSDANIQVGELVSDVIMAVPSRNVHGHASDANIMVGENVSEVTMAVSSRNIHGHASDANIMVGENVSEVTVAVPSRNIHGHASDANIMVGENVSEVTVAVPSRNIHGHASDANIMVGENVSEVTMAVPSRNIHGHASDAHIQVGELVSDVTMAVPSRNVLGHASDADIMLGENVSEVTVAVPSRNIHGHASDAHIQVGEHVSEVTTLTDSRSVHGHVSDAHIKKGELVSEILTPLPSQNIHGHASDAYIKVGDHVSEDTMAVPSPNIHGHASDNHFQVGVLVSDITVAVPSRNVHGHVSDAHIQVGEFVSEVTSPTASRSVHGHVSDAHIKIGELVSDVLTPQPSQNIHGHASDAHIKIGEHVSEVPTLTPSPNIHGHASDAHIKVGEYVSDVALSRPRWSKHGHSSDSTLKVGCLMPEAQPTHSPLPGSAYGHSSDSTLKVGCVVSGSDPVLSPLPGSAYGHSSDSTLGVGCVVMGPQVPKQPPLPGSAYGHSSDSTLGLGCVVMGPQVPKLPHLPGSAYGHSSDSTLGVGCVVMGPQVPKQPPLPGSAYGHSSDSSLGVGCVVQGIRPGSSYSEDPQTGSNLPPDDKNKQDSQEAQAASQTQLLNLGEGLAAWAQGLGLSPLERPEDDYLLKLASQYHAEQYEDSFRQMMSAPDAQLLQQVTRGPNVLPTDSSLHCATDSTAVQLSEMMPLPVLMKHSVTTPLITHLSMVNKAVVDYFFVELSVKKHFEALRHFLLMEDGEFALSLTDRLFEKLGSGQTPGELLTPLVLNSILNKAMQYSVHGDSELATNFTFALRYLPEVFHPHAPDSLNCLELRYKVDWPLNIIITDSCMNKYNRLFSFLLQLKHMVWSLSDVWFHLKRTALVKGAGRSVQFRQLQLYRHEMQHFVKVIQGYIANQILQVSWSEFTQKLNSANDLDAIHHTHAEYLNRAIFRALLTEKAAPVMNIIHSIFSLILKFRGQLIAQAWQSQQGETVHPSFVAMQQSYNTFKYYSRFLFKVVSKLVDKGYQPHLEDFLLRLNFNNYYKDS
ncbi:gamma-tubulin complex component 6 [Ictalurus punctatus]|uniref:Gamma-tubulin complex component 6 n=1 Tax=Ictalurus punctatus TaxID=7998 RepID=A0A2D0SC59_ICTPU|nr:gamma-tubulin complex component 6 [Ictalurus punctatus]